MPLLEFQTAPLAIVGVACRFPGADTLDQFWNLIVEGRSSYGELPPERLNRKYYFDPARGVPGKSYTATGGVVPLRPVDPSVCPIPADIASRYDRLPLNLCEVAAAACRHASYDPAALPFQRAGVYIGNSSGSDCEADHVSGTFAAETARGLERTESFRQLPEALRRDAISEIGAWLGRRYPRRATTGLIDVTPGGAAAAVATVLGTTGPAVVADAACASSFMALKLAADALHAGEVDAAIVGTAAYRNWYEYVLMSLAQSISAGTSCPFDARAAGLIAADGLAAIVVKTLPKALADGDRIVGVIRGLGLSSDGRGKSFWAPRREGQVAAIQRAYGAGVDPRRVQYLEAHATSTQVGDATEMESLAEALGSHFVAPVPIGSVKGNIGHTLEAAGMASLIKVLLAMQHGTIPPAANFEVPNPAIPWDRIPFRVPRAAEPWPASADGTPRRAAIDSFGIGGLNTHLVVDQVPEAAATFAPDPAVLNGSQSAEPIAIIGIGCVLPGAFDVAALERIVQSPATPSTEGHAVSSPSKSPHHLTGWEFDWKRHKIPPKQIAQANPLHFVLVEAADQALRDAGWESRPFDRSRTGVVVGSIFTGDFADDTYLGCRLPETGALVHDVLTRNGVASDIAESVVREYSEAFLKERPAARDDSASLSCSTLASRLSKQFDLQGGAMSLDAGDASAMAALSAAVGLLRSGACETVICAAGQRWVDRVSLETAEADAARSGQFLPPGEGSAVLVLKPLAAARRDGDRIRGIVREVRGECRNEEPAADRRPADATLKNRFGDLRGASGMAGILAAVLDPQSPARDIIAVARRGFAGRMAEWRAALEFENVRESSSGTEQPRLGGRAGGDRRQERVLEGASSDSKRTMTMQQTNGHPASRAPISAPAAGAGHEIESFLIAFVAEHNGFPLEVIDPDDDLETALQMGPDLVSEMLDEACRQFRADPALCRFKLRGVARSTIAALEAAIRECVSTAIQPDEFSGPTAPQVSTQPPPTLLSEGERIMQRFVLRAIDAPLPAAAQNAVPITGPFVLLGRNPVAEALRERLMDAGAVVHALPVGTIDEAVASLDALWQQAPALHLLIVTPRDEDAVVDLTNESSWHNRAERGVLLPLTVCQRWFTLVSKAGLMESASLTAVTALGGDFGLSGHGAAVEGGAIAGLVKALDVETRGRLRTKVIDTFPRDPAKVVASGVVAELGARAPDVEVGLMRGKRYTLKAVPQRAVAQGHREIERGGVWVVTGGARGVTAAVARELGRRFGLKLHLLGTTAPPEIPDAWLSLDENGRKDLRARVVREALAAKKNGPAEWARVEKGLEMRAAFKTLEADGVAFTYHACDIADRRQLAGVLEAIRAKDGPISGILHGAGVESAGRFEKKTRDGMARVLAAKAEGTAALIALTRDDPLRFFVGMGSTSGRFGAYVNADYAAANDLLAKMLDRLQHERPDLRAFTVHWTAWTDVGMGARDRSRFILDAIEVRGMPPLEGAAHLIDELEAPTTETEILICDHPDGVHSQHSTMPAVAEWPAVAARQSAVDASPLVDAFVRSDERNGTAFLSFDPVRDPFLNGHMDDGVPLLPAVIGIETGAGAAAIASGRTVVGLRAVKLLNGFRMAQPRVHHARIRVSLEGHAATCQLSGEFYDKTGRMTDPDRVFQSCIVDLADARRPLTAPEFGSPPESGWIEVPYPDDWRAMEGANSGTVYYGPELRSLKAVWHDAGGAWGRLVAPPVGEIGGARPGSAWHTPPSIFDALLFGCDLFASYSFGTKQLPHVIDRIGIARLPRTGEQCVSRILYRGRDGNRYTWDFWLLGDDGSVILDCQGCHFVDLNVAVPATTARA